MANQPKQPDFIVNTVKGEGRNAFWLRIGAAWMHEDGEGMNIRLDALPLNDRLVLRKPKVEEDQASE